ncbi:response regulator [Candidatus Uhrbacteria bacterium]|nr:response regulator [Candidatus Uhrbacteria bacterium]
MEKVKIVFIEDDAFLAQIYTKALDQAGYDVALAQNGEEGLKLIEREHPSLILLDILLPHMDGFEVLETLKSRPALQPIPVLVITNLGNKEDVDRAASLGAAGYLIKAHALPKDVVGKIQTILG